MMKRNITAVATLEPPFTNECLFRRERQLCDQPGINFEIFHATMTYLGFGYNVIRANLNEIGFQDLNGTLIGAVAQLVSHKADISVFLMEITLNRLKVIDFTAPVNVIGYGFLFKSVQEGSMYELRKSVDFLIHSSHLLLWYGLAIIAIWLPIFLVFTRWKIHPADLGRSRFRCVTESVVMMLRPLVMENCRAKGTLISTIIFLVWQMAVFVYRSHLEGNLHMQRITKPTYRIPFNDLDEFAEQVFTGKYTIAMTESVDRVPQRSNQEGGPWIKLEEAMAWNPPRYFSDLKSLQDALERNGSLVYHGSYFKVLSMASERCSLIAVEDEYYRDRWMAFGVPKGETELAKLVSGALFPSGDTAHSYMTRLYNKYKRKATMCPEETEMWSPSRGMNLNIICSLFIGLLLAYGVASVILIVEIVILYL